MAMTSIDSSYAYLPEEPKGCKSQWEKIGMRWSFTLQKHLWRAKLPKGWHVEHQNQEADERHFHVIDAHANIQACVFLTKHGKQWGSRVGFLSENVKPSPLKLDSWCIRPFYMSRAKNEEEKGSPMQVSEAIEEKTHKSSGLMARIVVPISSVMSQAKEREGSSARSIKRIVDTEDCCRICALRCCRLCGSCISACCDMETSSEMRTIVILNNLNNGGSSQ